MQDDVVKTHGLEGMMPHGLEAAPITNYIVEKDLTKSDLSDAVVSTGRIIVPRADVRLVAATAATAATAAAIMVFGLIVTHRPHWCVQVATMSAWLAGCRPVSDDIPQYDMVRCGVL
jgi:hypothetical protein